jgi:hypothetical protein
MGQDQQIISAYEQGMTPAQIAEDLGFPEYAVKAKLMAISSAYRKACGQEPEEEDELKLSREQQKMVQDKLFQTFLESDDENTITRLGIYLRDDGKGRHDVRATGQAVGTMNILQLVNGSIQGARAGARRLKESLGKGVVEV